MMKVGKLQIIIISVAIIGAIFGVLVFSGVIPGFGLTNSKDVTRLTMWGSLDEDDIGRVIADLQAPPNFIEISYQKKNPATFERELLDALARQVAPDLIIFPSQLILEYSNKLAPVPQELATERIFRDTFADGADILILQNGNIIGLPYLIDPLIFYYNKDLLRNESIAGPPTTWNEFLTLNSKLTKINAAGVITQSGAALGVETNINHFKELFSLLVMQTGAPIIERNLKVNFSPSGQQNDTVGAALRFYTDFANREKTSYSWSKAMPPSSEAFSRELSANYFGFASEYSSLRERNPHLNFDIASVPQLEGSRLNLTYGKFLSLGVLAQSRERDAAFSAVGYLVSRDNMAKVLESTTYAPSRRDLLKAPTGDAARDTIYKEAIRFKSWLDKDYARTSSIFGQMIQSVYTGAKTETEASRDAKLQLETLYNN